MRRFIKMCFFFVMTAVVGCTPIKNPPKTASSVDIKRYMGVWYEIASFPNRFQKGCRCTQATYTLQADGDIAIVNQCRRGQPSKLSVAKGKAWLSDPMDKSRSRLKVQFFWPFRGDYWILAIDPKYQVALVGSPQRNYLWVLARTRQLAPKVLQSYFRIAQERGYDLSKITQTRQKGCE